MNKTLLKGIAFGLGMLATMSEVSAQKAITYETNWAADQVGVRFMVNTPASVAGVKAYNIANDGSGATTEWGGAITNPVINVAVARAYGPGNDSFGTGALQNGVAYPSLVGKYALIFRGGSITFTRKAKLCQDAGAIGCIIVNNISGGPVGMAETVADGPVTIPVMMISDVDGKAINTELKNNVPVTVSITRWGVNATHDLGILPNGVVLPHAAVIPFHQLVTGNGNPLAYKNQTGAYVANFGTANETNVKVRSNVTWTPTNGGATSVHSDSVTLATFNRADSLMVPFVSSIYDLHANSTGRFDFTYSLSADSADGAMSDNSNTFSMYVSDTIFSKSRYDFANKRPYATAFYRFNGTNPFVTGPMYFVAKGGYQIKAVQFAVSAGTGLTPESFGTINVNVYRWSDLNADSVMENNEIQFVGLAQKQFLPSDSNQQFYTVDVMDPFDNTQIVKVQDNSWYWVAADMPSGSYVGCDGMLNYLPRTYIRSRATSESHTIDMFAPSFDGNSLTLGDTLSSLSLVRPIALESFIRGSFPDSARFAIHKDGLVPSISMLMSDNTHVGINNLSKKIGEVEVYPNPATTGMLNVSMDLATTSNNVYARIVDAMGKTVKVSKYSNVKKQTIQFSTADLAAGQYYVIINTDAGPIARKFTVMNK